MDTLAELFENLRLEKGWTKPHLSRETGIPYTTIRRLLEGNGAHTLVQARDLCVALDVPDDTRLALLGGGTREVITLSSGTRWAWQRITEAQRQAAVPVALLSNIRKAWVREVDGLVGHTLKHSAGLVGIDADHPPTGGES